MSVGRPIPSSRTVSWRRGSRPEGFVARGPGPVRGDLTVRSRRVTVSRVSAPRAQSPCELLASPLEQALGRSVGGFCLSVGSPHYLQAPRDSIVATLALCRALAALSRLAFFPTAFSPDDVNLHPISSTSRHHVQSESLGRLLSQFYAMSTVTFVLPSADARTHSDLYGGSLADKAGPRGFFEFLTNRARSNSHEL